MSNPIISFVSQLIEQDQVAWLALLSSKLPNECIKLDKDLSVDEKNQSKIAIVANPDPIILSQYPQLIWVQSLWAGVDALVSQLTETRNSQALNLFD